MRVDGKFHLLIIKASCPMVIILDHTTDRDLQMQLIEHF